MMGLRIPGLSGDWMKSGWIYKGDFLGVQPLVVRVYTPENERMSLKKGLLGCQNWKLGSMGYDSPTYKWG